MHLSNLQEDVYKFLEATHGCIQVAYKCSGVNDHKLGFSSPFILRSISTSGFSTEYWYF